MAPITVCGQTFLFGIDDVALLGPASLLIGWCWFCTVTSHICRLGAWRVGVAPVLLDAMAWLLLCGFLLDIWILFWGCQGPIMEPQHRRRTLGIVLARWAVNLLIAMMLAVQTVLIIVGFFLLGRQRYTLVRHVGGYMPTFGDDQLVLPHLAYLPCLLGMWMLYWGFFATLWLARAKTADVDSAAARGVEKALRFFGAHQTLTSEIMKVFAAVHGPETFRYVAPTDVFFGLLLHANRQEQLQLGSAPPDPRAQEDTPDDAEAAAGRGSRPQAGALRASLLPAARPLDPASAEDQASLRELNHFWPYALGIYGCCFNACVSTASEGTTIPDPLRLLRTLWAALPCRQRTPREVSEKSWRCCGVLPPQGNVKGDDWLGLSSMEYALRRTLDAAATAEGHHTPPKLVHATWDDLGLEKCPPFAIFVDDKRGEVVITIRGTLNMWDCLTDATAAPVAFDPATGVGVARQDAVHWNDGSKDAANCSLFDSDTGCFVHSGVWKCALDAKERMGSLLSDLKDSGAADYQVVCVGHSLGAAVACVLALLLRAHGGFADARYVGFAPPGATLSKKLTEFTASLGWVSGVCSHDVISRLSVHSLQELREKALRELAECERTKLQLAMLLWAGWLHQRPLLGCLLRPFVFMLEWLGGGGIELAGRPLPTHAEAVEAARGFLQKHGADSAPAAEGALAAPGAKAAKAAPPKEEKEAGAGAGAEAEKFQVGLRRRTLGVHFFPRLLVPGRVAYMRPTRVEPFLCGLALRDVRWTADWAQPQDLVEIVLTWRSVELHLPSVMGPAFRSALRELERRRPGGYGTFGA